MAEEMVSVAFQPVFSAVGAKLLFPNETIHHGGVISGIKGGLGHAHRGWPRNSSEYMDQLSMASNFSAVNGHISLLKNPYFNVLRDSMKKISSSLAMT